MWGDSWSGLRPLRPYRCRQMSDRCAAVSGPSGQLDDECQFYRLANANSRLIGAVQQNRSGSGHAPVAAVRPSVLVIALRLMKTSAWL